MHRTLSVPAKKQNAPVEINASRQAVIVQQLAAHLFQVSEEELLSPTRSKAAAALARQVAMYVCHVSLGFNFSDVGHFFGRDRTTASHACQVIEDRRDDREFDELIGRIETAISALGLRRRSFLMPFSSF